MKFVNPLLFIVWFAGIDCFYAGKATELSTSNYEDYEDVWYCQTKQEVCQFGSVSPNFFTKCENDAAICGCHGVEACDKCENDSLDPEDMYFCTAAMSDLDGPENELLEKPWVKCSDNCFSKCKLFHILKLVR